MKIVLVRHGEPDYSQCIQKKYFGHGLNLAPLTKKGCAQAEAVAKHECLNGAQLVVSSPYTRAMQTAAVISRIHDLPLSVDEDLHEWVPDLSYLNHFEDECRISDEFLSFEGFWPSDKFCCWEPIDALSRRVISTLHRYRNYEKIIVVCHAVVIFHLTGLNTIPHCCVHEIEFDDSFEPSGWFKKETV